MGAVDCGSGGRLQHVCGLGVDWGGRSRLPRCVAPSAAGCPRYPSLATGARGGFEGSRVGESAVYWVVASCCVRLPSLRPCNAATPELGLEMLYVRAPSVPRCLSQRPTDGVVLSPGTLGPWQGWVTLRGGIRWAAHAWWANRYDTIRRSRGFKYRYHRFWSRCVFAVSRVRQPGWPLRP